MHALQGQSKTHIYLQFIHFLQIESVFSRILLNTMKFLHGAISVREEKSQTICFLARHLHDRGFIAMSQIPDIWACAAVLRGHVWQAVRSSRGGEACAQEARSWWRESVPSCGDAACWQYWLLSKSCMQSGIWHEPESETSEFEKCDFINNRPGSLLEHSAFFGTRSYLLLAKWLAKHKEKLEGALAKQKIGFLHYATRNENIAIQRRLAQRELSNVSAVPEEAAGVPGDRDRELRRLQVSHCAKGNRLRCDFSGKQLTHVACGHRSAEILSDLLDNCSDRIDISSSRT